MHTGEVVGRDGRGPPSAPPYGRTQEAAEEEGGGDIGRYETAGERRHWLMRSQAQEPATGWDRGLESRPGVEPAAAGVEDVTPQPASTQSTRSALARLMSRFVCHPSLPLRLLFVDECTYWQSWRDGVRNRAHRCVPNRAGDQRNVIQSEGLSMASAHRWNGR